MGAILAEREDTGAPAVALPKEVWIGVPTKRPHRNATPTAQTNTNHSYVKIDRLLAEAIPQFYECRKLESEYATLLDD